MSRPHVLMYYRVMIPSLQLCGGAQLQALAEAGEIEYRCVQEDRLKEEDLAWADIALLPRLDSRYQQELAERLRKNGKYLIYMIDDDLLHVPAGMTSSPYYGLPSTQAHIRAMLAMSHAVISPSPRLLSMYAGEGQERVFVEEPAMWIPAFQPHRPGGKVTIGFAGSLDRSADADGALRSALLRIKAEYGGRVDFAFFGARPAFAEELGAACHPFCLDYETYLHRLSECGWDIGLGPMPDTPFHACKHYIKLTEYAAMGIAGLFTEVPPYDRAKAGGFPAAYCDGSAEGWLTPLRAWLDDPAALEEARRAAYDYACAHLTPEKTAESLRELIRRGMAYRASVPAGTEGAVPYRLRRNKALNWLWKGRSYVAIHRWRTPLDLIARAARYAK